MRITIIIVTVTVLSLAGIARAEETSIGFGLQAGPHLGAHYVDLSGLRDRLGSPADDLQNAAFVIGGEFNGFFFDRFVLGMAGSVGRQHSEGGGVEIDLIRYTMGPHFGLVVIDRGTLRFYPVVALGWAGLSGDVDAPSDARDAALDREDGGNGTGMIFGRNADLEYGAFTAGVALYLDYLFPIYRHEMGLAFVFTGARLGANFEAVSTGWEANGGDWPGDDPDFRYDHGFLRLAFGFGAGSPTKTVMDMHDKMHGGMHGGHEGHE